MQILAATKLLMAMQTDGREVRQDMLTPSNPMCLPKASRMHTMQRNRDSLLFSPLRRHREMQRLKILSEKHCNIEGGSLYDRLCCGVYRLFV